MMFPYLPNAGLTETLEWKTDILVSHNGTENRMSLREDPRVSLSTTFFIRNPNERVIMTRRTQVNLTEVFLVPFWQYGSKITQETPSGGNRVYFDPSVMSLSSGQSIIFLNIRTADMFSDTVVSVELDGAEISTILSSDLTRDYIALPASLFTLVSYQSRIDQITGEATLTFNSFMEYPLEGDGTSSTLLTLGGLPILEQKFLAGSQENLTYRYEIIDNDVGFREYRSRDVLVRFGGEKRFNVKRILQPEVMNYWRVFLNTVKGAWKPFLLSTQMVDMSVSTPPVAAASSITVNMGTYPFSPAFSNIEIEFTNGVVIRRRINSVVDNGSTHTLNLSAALPNNSYVENVRRISYLLKVRMADTVRLVHGPFETEISFDVLATNEG